MEEKSFLELGAQEMINLLKSNGYTPTEQIELIKAQAEMLKSQPFGRVTKDEISTSTGAGSRSATKPRTMAQPGAPGENVGQIDNPDTIQNRFRDEYVEESEYNKGDEADDDVKKSPKKKATANIDSDDDGDTEDVQHGDMGDGGEFMPDGDEPGGDDEDDEDDAPQGPPMKQSNKKSAKKSYSQNDYATAYYAELAKGGEEIDEVVNGAPVVQYLADVNQRIFSSTSVKLDKAIGAIQSLTTLVKSQAREIDGLKRRMVNNHNKQLEYTQEVMKSFAQDEAQIAKSQAPAAPARRTPAPEIEMPRPTMNGALAIVTPGGNSLAKSNRLTGDFKRDKKMLLKSIEAAAERGDDGATDLLSEIDLVKEAPGFQYIVAKMPEEWLGGR